MEKTGYLGRVFLIVWPALLLGCASVETVRNAPTTSGEERVFDAAFERMDAIVAAALPLLGLENIDREFDESGAAVFVGTHGTTAASWGEVVRVIVTEIRHSPAAASGRSLPFNCVLPCTDLLSHELADFKMFRSRP